MFELYPASRLVLLLLLLFEFGVFMPSVLRAQEIEVPVDTHWSLFTKVLSFDRALGQRVGRKIVVGILYQSRFRPSVDVKEELVAILARPESRSIMDATVTTIPIDIEGTTDVQAQLAAAGVNIAYLAPLRAVNITAIAGACLGRKTLSVSGVPGYVAEGIAVGFAERGGHPRILINLSAAKGVGADFSSQLLNIATVTP